MQSEYLTLDLESVVNPKAQWEPQEWMKKEPKGKVFAPPSAQRIISACSMKLAPIPGSINEWVPSFVDYGPSPNDIVTDSEDGIPEDLEYDMVKSLNLTLANVITRGGTVITFNGRGFDIPLLYARCMVFGLNTAGWYTKDFRYRFSTTGHLDLLDILTEYGAVYKARPSLATLCHLCGLPGKVGIDGSMVGDHYKKGNHAEIRDYCMSDNLDTGIIFLRWLVSKGALAIAEYQQLVLKIVTEACVKDENEEVVYPLMCQILEKADQNVLYLIRKGKS